MGICLTLVIGLTTASVFARYIFNSPFAWTEEMQMLLFVWMAFFGSSVAFRYNNHIAIEVVVDAFPAKWRRIVEAVNSVLVFLVLGLVAYFEFRRGFSLIRSGRTTAMLQIPQALNYLGVAAACLFMMANLAWQKLAGKPAALPEPDCAEGASNE